MTEHTKTPWIIDPHYPTTIWDADEIFVATTESTSRTSVGLDYSKEHERARHIVQAVNSHEALIEALEGILAITDRKHVAWDAAHAALELARKEQP